VDDFLLWRQFWSFTIEGLTLGSIYALVALGYTLVYGVLRLINFAHSEVFMIGTFGALWAYGWLGIDPGDPQTGVGILYALVIALVVAMACSGGTAIAIERIGYKPLRDRNAPRLAFLISAIGMSIAIAEGFALWRERNLESIGEPVPNTEVFGWFDATVTRRQLIIIGSAIGMMFLLDLFVRKTRFGRGIRALAQDPETATLMGVNRDRVIQLTFLLGGLMAGVAGVLWAVRYGNTRYNIGFLPGVKAFAAAVLGGIGNLRGALLGGLLLGVVENWGAAIFGSSWKDVIAFVVLVVVLMFRPEGILGESLGRARV
jgi:branched-chain amino acid transport system permease protein